MTAFAPWIFAYLANSLWQIPLLFLAGWTVALLVRRTGPGAEHRVWIGVLMLQVVTPIASTRSWQPLWIHLTAFIPAQNAGRAHASVFQGSGMAISASAFSTSALHAVAASYLLLCLCFATRLLWRSARLRTLRRTAIPLQLSESAGQLLAQYCRRFRISAVTLASSVQVAGPVALGVRHPLILLPESMATGLDAADFEAIVGHELAHLRRHDFLLNFLCEVMALPAAWHPALWLTRRRIAESRELACDRMAAEFTGSLSYTQSLLRLASQIHRGTPTPHALGLFDTIAFERRIMNLTASIQPLGRARRLVTVVACTVLSVATCGSALAFGLHPSGAPGAFPQPSNARPVHVPAGVMAGNRLSGEIPKYPKEAKKHHIQGRVILNATISEKGTIEHLAVVSGPKELQQSAEDAVRTWKYKPFVRHGEPMAVKTTILVIYSLGNGPAWAPAPPTPESK